MSVIVTILVIILLLFINALYVAAEFSAVSARRLRIEKLAEEGNSLARMVLPVINDSRKLDEYVSTCQMGITVASLVLGAYGQVSIADHLVPLFEKFGGLQTVAANSLSATIVLIFLSVLQMLFGEFIPKTLAIQHSNRIALYTILPVRWSRFLFSWFIAVLNGTAIAVLKILGIPPVRHRHIHSPEEIGILIKESHEGGILETEEKERLHKALNMSAKLVRHFMVPRAYMYGINVKMPLEEAMVKIAMSPYSRLPVYSGTVDNVTGILHIKEIMTKKLERKKINSIEEIVTPVLFVPENMRVDRLMKVFREEYSEMAVVVDEFGGVAGVITIEDLMTEVLGPVSDEFKITKIDYEKLSDGRMRICGNVSAFNDEITGLTGIRWKGEANTIGGQIVEVIKRIPEDGEIIYIDGAEIKIDEVKRNAIQSLVIKPCNLNV